MFCISILTCKYAYFYVLDIDLTLGQCKEALLGQCYVMKKCVLNFKLLM